MNNGIVAARVNWWENYANSPTLEVLVYKMWRPNEIKHSCKGGLYYGERDGIAHFCFHNLRDESGYGGREFHLLMEDGSTKIIKGPWSSRASCLNREGFGPCLDVSITDNIADYSGRGIMYAGAITLDLAKLALSHIQNFPTGFTHQEGDQIVLQEIDRGHGEICYVPAIWRKGGSVWTKNATVGKRTYHAAI